MLESYEMAEKRIRGRIVEDIQVGFLFCFVLFFNVIFGDSDDLFLFFVFSFGLGQ